MLSQYSLPQLPQSFQLQPKISGSLCARASFPVVKIPATDSTKNKAEEDVGGTSEINMEDKSDKGESKNEGSTAGNKNFAEASNW